MKTNKLCGVTALLALLFALVLPATAFAQDAPAQSGTTTLTVEVPAQSFTVALQADGAEVLYNGAVCTGSLLVPRDSTPTLLLRPVGNRAITRVLVGGQPVAVQGGYITLPAVTGDVTLTVETAAVPVPTVRRFTVIGHVTRDGQPLAGATAELRSTPRTAVTAADGSFRFDDVESGHHSLTVLQNGVAIGYVEFIVNEGANASLVLQQDGSYLVTVTADAATVNFDFAQHNDGKIAITQMTVTSGGGGGGGSSNGGSNGGSGSSGSGSGSGGSNTAATRPAAPTTVTVYPTVPPTADSSIPALWAALLVASALGIVALRSARRKRDR